jgi:branched-chain amino acid aminotransferase
VIHLLQDWGIPVSERRLAIQELYEANQAGRLEEAFGTGTAAVISPVGELFWANQRMEINGGKTGGLSRRLYDTLTGIQNGVLEDKFGWTDEID